MLQDEGSGRLLPHLDRLSYLMIVVTNLASLRHALLNMLSPTSDLIISSKRITAFLAFSHFYPVFIN